VKNDHTRPLNQSAMLSSLSYSPLSEVSDMQYAIMHSHLATIQNDTMKFAASVFFSAAIPAYC